MTLRYKVSFVHGFAESELEEVGAIAGVVKRGVPTFRERGRPCVSACR